jgi:hypothetical protein
MAIHSAKHQMVAEISIVDSGERGLMRYRFVRPGK